MAGAMVRVPNPGQVFDGESGHTYLKLDAGMTDVLRPSLYAEPSTPLPYCLLRASQLTSVKIRKIPSSSVTAANRVISTPKPGETGRFERTMRKADIGDFLIMDGCGAYCSEHVDQEVQQLS
jgi:diaminopimelate decarboxylase